ncbi:matrin 3-like 1.1 isoform X2 [Channa argus]|uniref:matrin 3-like 1.1 isoform X2 n=1 Tax=Channa argus TaxID=215402 RepID=UPI00351FAA14
MSHNYPYRRPPSDTDLRSEAGPYRSTGRRHASPDRDFYRPPQESFSSSYPSSSSSRSLTSAQCSQDGALSILSSCGLEPSDLALLAELPEDVLTVESLPHVLAQIKGKRGTIRSFPSNCLSAAASSSSSSYHRPPVSSSTSDRDHLSSQLVQYPIDQVTHGPLLSEQDCWGNPRISHSVGAHPTPSSTRYVVDFNHRPGPPEYGKIVRATGPVSSQELPSFSSAGQGSRTYPAHFSEPRSADYRTSPPPDEYHPKPRGGHRESQTSSVRSSSREAAAASMPSEKKALDFHGTCPTAFPYSCSLCDITVLSEKVWIKHINGTQHAEGQLTLLQQFSNWDCRLESLSRANNHSENRKDEEKTSHSSQTANQNHKPQPNIKPEKKASEKSKVVCVRFPPQSVDEAYLRKLTEPFGKIVKILMFPSLAFVELGSIDQAKDLVKFHINYPPTVNGEKIEFRISNTFNFLQSSQVVSFTPVPKGEDGKSDLISIVKRFGPLLYTLFLPSMAFVEMKNGSDAQKLIDHYSSNTLRIKDDYIKVAFSGEHKTLMRVPSAKRYEEETFSTKRSRSLSREKDNSKRRKRSSSKDQEGRNKKSSRERRSRDESNKHRKTRSRSKDKIREKSSRGTRSRSKSRPTEKSSKESKNRRSRSREKSSREKRTNTRPSSRDKSSSRSSRLTSSRQKALEETTAETKSRTKGEQTPLAAEKPQTDEKAALSAGESDIEGMEVIGEDGENLEEEDVEIEENEVKENNSQAERPEEDKKMKDRNEAEKDRDCEMKVDNSETRRETKEATETQLEDDKEPDFPVDLENCITLDELQDQSDGGGEHDKDEAKAPSTRVIYFKDLPMSFYTDVEFVRLVKYFGKAVRYLLIRRRQEGFIEMSSSLEAQKAAKELSCKFITFKGSKVNVRISHRYYRLSNGWEVPLNSDKEKRSQSQTQSQSSSSRRKSERLSKSKTSDRDEICENTEGKESSKKTPEKESGSKTSTEKKPDKDSPQKKTQEKDLKNSSKKESNGRKSPESESKKSALRESSNLKTQEKDVRNTVEKEINVTKSPEKEASNKKAPRGKPVREAPNKKPSQEDSVTADKEPLGKNPEQMKIEKECDARKSPDKELEKTCRSPDKESLEDEPSSGKTEKNSVAKSTKGLEKQLLPGMSQDDITLNTTENDLVPEKTLKTDSDSESSQAEKEHLETGEKEGSAQEGNQKSSEGQGVCLKEEPSEPAVTNPDLLEQPIKQEAYNKQQLQDSEEAEQGPVPAWDAAGPEKPTKPVGEEIHTMNGVCSSCRWLFL